MSSFQFCIPPQHLNLCSMSGVEGGEGGGGGSSVLKRKRGLLFKEKSPIS